MPNVARNPIAAYAQPDGLTASKGRVRAIKRKSLRRSWSWVHWVLLRAFTCFVVCFAVPGCATLTQDVVTWVNGGECCDGDCDESSNDCCPKTCAHCAHANAVTPLTESLVLEPGAAVVPFFWWTEDASASGYRAPPFRPPAA